MPMLNLTTASNVAPMPSAGAQLAREARWFLAYALVVQTAFQFLLQAWSEVLEVLLFLSITGAFLLATAVQKGLRGLVGLATDTWTQRLAALFLGGLALSFLWGDQSGRSVLALLRLPTYLVVIAIVVECMRSGTRRMLSLAWTALGAISFVYLLTFIEFYWGSDLFGLACADVPRCWLRKHAGWHWEGLLSEETVLTISHFARHGGILNATVIGEAYGLSRLGMFGIAAYALGMGIVLTADRMGPRLIAGGLVTFVLLGVMLSGSRSSTLVILVLTVVVTALVVLNTRSLRLVRTCLVANLVILAVLFLCWQIMPAGITAVDRLVTPSNAEVLPVPRLALPVPDRPSDGSPEVPVQKIEVIYSGEFDVSIGRREAWLAGLDMFMASPVGGIGFRMFQPEYSRRHPGIVDIGIHSGYLKVIVEAGFLGAVMLLALVGRALAVMLLTPGLSPKENVWRIAFLSALIGMLAVNVVDTHSEDRFFWIVLAFSAVLESRRPPGQKLSMPRRRTA